MCQHLVGNGEKVSCAITKARDQHQTIVQRLMNGPSDAQGAMYRAERMFGLSYWRQWNLRHKKRATHQFMQQVHDAYRSCLQRSVEREIELLQIDQAKGAANADLENLENKARTLLAEIKAARKAAGK